jgi:two-component system sensor histidine kinase AlgZ
MVWIFALGPFVSSVLLDRTLFSSPWTVALRHIAANYIPFIVIPTSFGLLYRFVLPPWYARVRGRVARAMMNVVVIAAVSVSLAQLIYPLHRWALQKNVARIEFSFVCLVLSLAFLVPALLIQSLRNRSRALEERAIAERQAALEAQLAALRARTNPHFLFNSINTVASLIPDDPELAERTLERMADLFRYALEASRLHVVPLGREIEMIRDYLAIQSARFGPRLRAEVTLDDAVAQVGVPPLLLQPLVENAILHGLGERKSGGVAVSARGVAEELVIEVRDDGGGLGSSRHQGSGTSLGDLRALIQLRYGDRGSFALAEDGQGGCVARLRLPLA